MCRNLISKKLWRDSFTVTLGVIASLEALLAITDLGIKDFASIDKWWIKALIIICVFLFFWTITAFIKASRAKRKVCIKIRGIRVTITVGDIFSTSDWKVIPFNEFFDTQVNDEVIAFNSLNGRFITEHVSNIDELNKTISQTKDVTGLKRKSIGGRNAYPLGRIITYGDYMLLAFSHFRDNQAIINHSDYEKCLRTMWHEISRVYANRPVTLPLLGGGITRFEDISEKSELHLLRCLLCTLKTSDAQIFQPITIFLTREVAKKINLYEIKKIF